MVIVSMADKVRPARKQTIQVHNRNKIGTIRSKILVTPERKSEKRQIKRKKSGTTQFNHNNNNNINPPKNKQTNKQKAHTQPNKLTNKTSQNKNTCLARARST